MTTSFAWAAASAALKGKIRPPKNMDDWPRRWRYSPDSISEAKRMLYPRAYKQWKRAYDMDVADSKRVDVIIKRDKKRIGMLFNRLNPFRVLNKRR